MKRAADSFNCFIYHLGVASPDSGIGVYAPDQESYHKFAMLFNPIIDDYHEGFGPEAVHPPTDFGENNISGN